jgi:hypothetical protein
MVGGAAVGGLQADATETPGVAGRGGGERRFPTAKEEILGGETVIIHGAAGELGKQPVVGEFTDHLPDQRIELPVVVVPG